MFDGESVNKVHDEIVGTGFATNVVANNEVSEDIGEPDRVLGISVMKDNILVGDEDDFEELVS